MGINRIVGIFDFVWCLATVEMSMISNSKRFLIIHNNERLKQTSEEKYQEQIRKLKVYKSLFSDVFFLWNYY